MSNKEKCTYVCIRLKATKTFRLSVTWVISNCLVAELNQAWPLETQKYKKKETKRRNMRSLCCAHNTNGNPCVTKRIRHALSKEIPALMTGFHCNVGTIQLLQQNNINEVIVVTINTLQAIIWEFSRIFKNDWNFKWFG